MREARFNTFSGNWSNGYRSPEYFVVGMEVLMPWENNSGLLCKVICAAGYNARIVNEKYKIDRWVDLLDVAIIDK